MDAVFLYLKESSYPNGSAAIRRKAAMFCDGVLYNPKNGEERSSWGTKYIIYTQYLMECSVVAMQVLELRFVRTREEQIKILAACQAIQRLDIYAR